MTVRVFQGEREMAADNRLLGQFNLEGIPPAPRGVPQIEVKFDIDANGIVNVSAKDKASGKEQAIRIQASGGLNEADIQRMVQGGRSPRRGRQAAKRAGGSTQSGGCRRLHNRKELKEAEGRAPPNVKSEVEEAVSQLKEAIKGEDVQRIKQATERLSQAALRLGEAMQHTRRIGCRRLRRGRRRPARRRRCRVRGGRQARPQSELTRSAAASTGSW